MFTMNHIIAQHLPPPARIIVGMSGGVDSSVTALILQQQGYQVEGLFMKNWEGDDTIDHCPAKADMLDAQQVCDQLGIPLHIRNFSQAYWDGVFEHFLQEYALGRTPNPDILCNKEIKFKTFLEEALALGADGIATGHYARIASGADGLQLRTGLDPNKDQSYFLYTLKQHQLTHSLFPIGELEKPVVRQLAGNAGFITHDKKDSTGICFIGERKFKDFLQRYLPAQPGDMVTPEGHVAGRHEGLMYYTIGQRKGLGIGGGHSDSEDPWFVAGKDMDNNRLIVVQGHDHPLLQASGLTADTLEWVGRPPTLNTHLAAKVRYRQQAQPCRITQLSDTQLTLVFDQPQRAVTPGQALVLYDGDVCLGGATIARALP